MPLAADSSIIENMTGFRDVAPGPGFDFEHWVDTRTQEYAQTLAEFTEDHVISAQVISDTHDEVLRSLSARDCTLEQLTTELGNIKGFVGQELAHTHSLVDGFLQETYADVARLVSYKDRKLLEAADEEIRISGPGSPETMAMLAGTSDPNDAQLLTVAHDYSLWRLLQERTGLAGADHADVGAVLQAVSTPEARAAMAAGLDHVIWQADTLHFGYEQESAGSFIMVPKPASSVDVHTAMAAGSDYSVLLTVQRKARDLPPDIDISEQLKPLLRLATPLGRKLIQAQDFERYVQEEPGEEPTPRTIRPLSLGRYNRADRGLERLGIVGLAAILAALGVAQAAEMTGFIAPEIDEPDAQDEPDGRTPIANVELSLDKTATSSAASLRFTHVATSANEGVVTEKHERGDAR